jgi:hypothetical protein
LNHPPTFCLALLAVSSTGRRELDALRESWSRGAEGFLPSSTCVDLAEGRDAAAALVHRSLFEAIADAYGSSAARLLALRRQHTAFRIVHDQLQNAFDTVETFLTRTQLPPIWLPFACEPTRPIGPQTPDGPFRLTQLLPSLAGSLLSSCIRLPLQPTQAALWLCHNDMRGRQDAGGMGDPICRRAERLDVSRFTGN